MNEILNMSVNEMPGCEFDCSCGKHHSFSVHDMVIGKDALLELPRVAEPFKDKKILMVYDNNTKKVAGERAFGLLKEAGFNVKDLLFDTGSEVLIPDEKTLGRILQEHDLDLGLIIGVGGGVINDSVKFVTSRTKIPYIIVATAPSMDGYVSDGAPIISEGYKYSPTAHLTYGLIGDTDVLSTAPLELIHAGFGDVVGKITAIADWDLAVKVNGDYRCDTCVELVNRALEKCFAKARGLDKRDPEALGNLLEALTLTGVAMALVNISRPASGAEHMLSHFWEMDQIARGESPLHHGIMVGVATPVIARFYEEMEEYLPEGTKELCPSHEEIEALLRRGGTPVSPKEIGISRELFFESLLKGYTIRDRHSVMRFAKDKGCLEEIAEKITAEIYG